ncbi:MAG: tetratricopeptide repeat protein, partial [Planctomycetaceae bacterium]
QHAHQKGIIHRDIKPSNVMVSIQDNQPIVKVIDFGLAKATDQRLTDKTLYTSIGQMVGTPAYMSPEQANPGEDDVDTRTDVYSLGALLYELLTGLRPIDNARLQNAAAAEMVRIIQEDEPTKPSSRISSAESLPSLSAVRRTEPRKLMSILRGELDWVVMKCLEKDRERRYGTANALAGDVRRYLSDEPVEARPPSRSYRLSKFLKRNKGTATAASLVVLALVAGIVGTSYGLFKAETARVEAVDAWNAESRRADAEQAANEQAQKRLGQLTKFNDILSSIFVSLDPTAAANERRPLQAILVDQLGDAADQLDAESVGDPLVVAEMQTTLGSSLLALSSPLKAIALLEKSRSTQERILGTDDVDTVTSLNFLAEGHMDAGQPEIAVPMFEEAVQRRMRAFGDEHPETIIARNNLALGYQAQGKLELAVSTLAECVEKFRATLGPEHKETLSSIGNLASAYEEIGQPELAIPLFEEALRIRQTTLGLEHPDTLISMNNVAFGYEAIGDLDQALPIYEGALPLMKKVLGVEHTSTLGVMGNLGDLYQEVGDFDRSLPLLQQAFEVSSKELGDDHPDTVNAMASLASIYQATGKVKDALKLFKEADRLLTEQLGTDHPRALMATNNLAMAHQANGELDVALPLLVTTLEKLKAAVGDDHPSTLTCMSNLAGIYQDTGKMEWAIPLYETSLAKQKETLGDGHPDTFMTMNNLATAYWATKRFDKSVPVFEQLTNSMTELAGRDHPNTLMTITNLGVNLKDSGDLKRALPLLEEGYNNGKPYPWVQATAGPQLLDAYAQAGQKTDATKLAAELLQTARPQVPPDSTQLTRLLVRYGQMLLKVEAFAEAEPILRECLVIREKSLPDSWLTANSKSLVGATLLGQEKYDEAEPLLLTGYEEMQQRKATMKPANKVRLIEALERLVQLYEATGKTEDAQVRKDELKALKSD